MTIPRIGSKISEKHKLVVGPGLRDSGGLLSSAKPESKAMET